MWDGQRFLERFVTSVSFSAYLFLVRRVLPAEYMRGLVPLWSACVVSVRLRGLQDVCAMLAGQGIADLVPMPMEPSGYLVLPAVLVYLMLLSSLGWAVYQGAPADTPMGSALTTVLDQYLSLFSVTRAVRAFADGGQTYPLRALSIVYTALAPSPPTGGQWTGFWQRNLEGVAMRGATAWLLEDVLRPQCASGEALLVLQIACIYLSGGTPRLSGIHAVLSTEAARHLLRLLAAAQLSDATCVWGLASVAMLLTRTAPRQTHMFAELCAFVTSLLLTSALEKWLAVVGSLEAGTLYMVLLCLLDVLCQQVGRLLLQPAAKLPAQGDDALLPLAPAVSLW